MTTNFVDFTPLKFAIHRLTHQWTKPVGCSKIKLMKGKALRVCKLLDKEYGHKVLQTKHNPLDELILTILSQNTTAKNCHQAFNSLKRRFPNWEAVIEADVGQVVEAIKMGGLENIKARRIKHILRSIFDSRTDLDLNWLSDLSIEEAKDYLLSFKGVGWKTVNCVLLFALGKPVLPVDTHVYRVAKRLGLIGSEITAEKAHQVLQDMLSEDEIYCFHINMVTHGRRICKAKRPFCPSCVLIGECEYVKP